MSGHRWQRIADDVVLGEAVVIYDFVNLYGCEIGAHSQIGTFVEIQKGVRVGAGCKISTHSFICEGVTIGDGVFIGHNVTFINDSYPRALNQAGELQREEDWELQETIVQAGASIGSGAVILGGVTVGSEAIVGAGSVVTHSVAPRTIVAGNPARVLRLLDDQ